MAKNKTSYVCQSCGNEFVKWAGKCAGCGEWNTLVETTRFESSGPTQNRSSKTAKSRETSTLKNIKLKTNIRVNTGIKEFDKSLGGGLVKGQVLLIAGEPGIGKSTLLLQMSQNIKNVFYVSGEESLSQLKLRADRLKVNNESLSLISETNIDTILATADKLQKKTDLGLIVIDSIQTMYTDDLVGVPGSVGQVREAALRLIRFAKKAGVPVVLVGHVTKGGAVAGPSTLMHMVDTVCWFEGEKRGDLRLIRIMKNRFGPTDEIALFTMGNKGLSDISDLDGHLNSEDRLKGVAGTITSCMLEGSRTILIEVQALVVPSNLAMPRRVVQGIDSKRVELILAVLTRHCKLRISDADVFVNIAGGIKVRDTSIDLAVAIALASSFKNKPVPSNLAAVGEVGLLGDVRQPSQIRKYLSHLKKHNMKVLGPDEIQICKILGTVLS